MLLAADIGGDSLETAAAVWNPVQQVPASTRGAESFLKATEFDAFTIDDALFDSVLATAPLDRRADAKIRFSRCYSRRARASSRVGVRA